LEEQLDLMKKKLAEYPIFEQRRDQQGKEGVGRREEGAGVGRKGRKATGRRRKEVAGDFGGAAGFDEELG
jgi:hypothetical protein